MQVLSAHKKKKLKNILEIDLNKNSKIQLY